MTILQRVTAPTPKFFTKVRNGGLLLGSLGASLLLAHAKLPPVLVDIAGYLTVAGGVATTVSQAATSTGDAPKDETDQ